MSRRRSLRADLVRAFWLFGGSLVLVFAVVLVTGANEQEDMTMARQLGLELDEYWARNHEALSTGSRPPQVTSRFVRAYVGVDSLPEPLRGIAADLAEGVHAIEEGIFRGEDYFVAIRELPDGSERLYLVYDVRMIEELEEFGWPSIRVFVVGAVAVGLLGLAAASRMSRRVLEPVTDLEQTVSLHTDPHELAEQLADRRGPPELDALSSALERSMRRIDDFVERERQFTRNASHELRTPVTVIRGATELLEQSPAPERAARLAGRIRRATDQMEDLIETFLWLARENEGGSASWHADLGTIARDVAERHRPLLKGRPVSVELDLGDAGSVQAPPQAVSVVISNLVKNAYQSTLEGTVRLEACAGRLRVIDTGPGPGEVVTESAERPRGFGLTIVGELCERFGWQASLTRGEAGGTVATVDFAPGDL